MLQSQRVRISVAITEGAYQCGDSTDLAGQRRRGQSEEALNVSGLRELRHPQHSLR